MSKDNLCWDKRDITPCQPGSNRSRANARKLAKKAGNKKKRKDINYD